MIELSIDKGLFDALDSQKKLSRAKRVVKRHGARLSAEAIRHAVFRGPYTTGATRQSIYGEQVEEGLGYHVAATTHYSGFVEVGTRKMAAQPFMRPAVEKIEPKFIEELESGQ